MLDGLTLQVLDSAQVGDEPWGVAVNEARNRVYVLGFADGSLTTLDGASLAVLHTQTVGREPTAIRVDQASGRIFVVLYGTNTLSVLDGSTDPPVLADYVSTRAYGSWGIAFNPMLNRVYVSGRDSQTITTLDGNNGWRAIEDQTIGTRNGCVPYAMEYVRAYGQLFVACAAGHERGMGGHLPCAGQRAEPPHDAHHRLRRRQRRRRHRRQPGHQLRIHHEQRIQQREHHLGQ